MHWKVAEVLWTARAVANAQPWLEAGASAQPKPCSERRMHRTPFWFPKGEFWSVYWRHTVEGGSSSVVLANGQRKLSSRNAEAKVPPNKKTKTNQTKKKKKRKTNLKNQPKATTTTKRPISSDQHFSTRIRICCCCTLTRQWLQGT